MDFNELNKQSYDKIADEFSATRHYVWRDVEIFRDYMKDGDKVLDLGCGNGRMVGLFNVGTGLWPVHRSVRVDYFGVDASEKLVEIARKKYPDKQFAAMDALNLNLPEKSFDVVLAVSVLNHFGKKDHRRFIENVKNVLKPNGYLLMVNWNLWNIRNKKARQGLRIKDLRLKSVKNRMTIWKASGVEAALYYFAFTKGELAKLLKGSGFQVIKNFYSRKGGKSSRLFGENIVSIAKLN